MRGAVLQGLTSPCDTGAGERVCKEGAGSQDPLPDHGAPAQADAGHDGQAEGTGEAAKRPAEPVLLRPARAPPTGRYNCVGLSVCCDAYRHVQQGLAWQ